MSRSSWPPRLGALVAEAWGAIPEQDRRRLASVEWEVVDPHEMPDAWGKASAELITLRSDIPDGLLGRAVVAHELAHAYGRHSELVRYGEMKAAAAEVIADAMVLQWLGRDAFEAIQRHRAGLQRGW